MTLLNIDFWSWHPYELVSSIITKNIYIMVVYWFLQKLHIHLKNYSIIFYIIFAPISKLYKVSHEDNIKSIEVFVPKMAWFVSTLHELYFEICTCWEIYVWFYWIFAWFWNTLNWPLLCSLSGNKNSNWAMWAY